VAEPAGPGPATILYVQQYPDGGSVTSLLGLVQGLDRARYRPIVAFRTPNEFLDQFRLAGCEVVVLDEAVPASAPPAGADADAPPIARRADGAPAARSSSWRRQLRRFVRRDLRATRQLLDLLREHRADLVHANNEVLSNRYAILAATRLRLPVVVHLRGTHDYERGVDRPIDRLLARRVRRAIAISHSVADHAADALPALAGRIEVVDNPFDLRSLPAPTSGTLAADLGLAGDAEVVVLLARVAWWKGQDVVVRAMAELRATRPNAVAVLVGAPSSTYGEQYLVQVRALAEELGVADRVHVAGFRSDVPEVLALADVVVHASTEPEPFGRVIVEAMAAGRPVVAAADGGVLEIVDDGETGLLVPPGDAVALAAAIDRLLGDPELARRLGAEAQVRARARFSLGAHAEAVQRTYDEVLGR
jgi:glycosyltransferase involved in cell wall biosynthesis